MHQQQSNNLNEEAVESRVEAEPCNRHRPHQSLSPVPTELIATTTASNRQLNSTVTATASTNTRQHPYSVDALMQLLTSIRACDPRITKVQIIDKKLPAAYLNALLHAIASHPGISKLQLCRTGATDSIGPALAMCILRSPSLTCLDLRKNSLSDQTVRLLSQALVAAASSAAAAVARQQRRQQQRQQQSRRDNSNSQNSNDGDDDRDRDSNSINHNHHDIDNDDDNDDIEEEPVSVISRLNLEDNCISQQGMLILCQALPKTLVSYVRLGKNPCWTSSSGRMMMPQSPSSSSSLGDKRNNMTAWKAVLHLLIQRQSPLKRLDIRKSGIAMPHVAGLAAALVDPRCQLESLGLSDNLLDDHAVTVLATALKHNKHLLTLDLQRNTQLGDIGASAMVHALQTENHTFQRVKLRYTAVSAEIKAQLLDCLLMNAHGPELAKRTKQIIQEQYSWVLLQKLSMLSFQEDSETSTIDDFATDEHETLSSNSNSANHSHSSSSSCQECVICYNPLQRSAMLLPCQHDNCCPDCGERLHSCHMCRTPIVKVIPVSSRRSPYSS